MAYATRCVRAHVCGVSELWLNARIELIFGFTYTEDSYSGSVHGKQWRIQDLVRGRYGETAQNLKLFVAYSRDGTTAAAVAECLERQPHKVAVRLSSFD